MNLRTPSLLTTVRGAKGQEYAQAYIDREPKVDPYRVWLFNGTFYLIGYYYMRNLVRIFALDQIKMLHQTKDTFFGSPRISASRNSSSQA